MATSLHNRPAPTEYPPFYGRYVETVGLGDILALMRKSGRLFAEMLAAISEPRAGFRYADGKWSIREVVGHVTDAERVFSYRALRFARGDVTPVPGFDENEYARASNADARSLVDLAADFQAVRESSLRLFASLSAGAWEQRGTANGQTITVRALAYVTVGHVEHHMAVLHERYLVKRRS